MASASRPTCQTHWLSFISCTGSIITWISRKCAIQFSSIRDSASIPARPKVRSRTKSNALERSQYRSALSVERTSRTACLGAVPLLVNRAPNEPMPAVRPRRSTVSESPSNIAPFCMVTRCSRNRSSLVRAVNESS